MRKLSTPIFTEEYNPCIGFLKKINSLNLQTQNEVLLMIPSRTTIANLTRHLSDSELNWRAVAGFLKEGFWEGYGWKLLGLENQSRLFKLTQIANQVFAKLEEKAIQIYDLTPPNENLRGRERELAFEHYKKMVIKAENYKNKFSLYFDFYANLRKRIKVELKAEDGQIRPELREAYNTLKCNYIGLKYRLGKANGGTEKFRLERNPLTKQLAKYKKNLKFLKEQALKWKGKEYLSINKNSLNEQEIKQLEDAATYHEWMAIFRKNSDLRDDFFKYALRDGNRVDVFILCPNTQKTLKSAFILSYFGRVRRPGTDELLQFRDINTKTKEIKKRVLAMPIYKGEYHQFNSAKQEWVNILKPTRVVNLEIGNRKMKLSEVWYQLRQRDKEEVNVNFCKWGLINLHPTKGFWDADKKAYIKRDLTKDNWTNFVPPMDVVTTTEMTKQYGNKIDHKNFFFKVAATRESKDLYALKTHGFWQLYLYMGDAKWRVLDVGVYADRFTNGRCDELKTFGNTLKRVLAFIDQNGSLSHRQKGALPLFPNDQEGKSLLEEIYDISQSKGVFQFAGQNCSYPVQRSVEKTMRGTPNFFKLPFTKFKIGFLLDGFLAFLDKCPAIIRGWGLWFIHKIIGGSREMTVKVYGQDVKYSVRNYYQNNETAYHPALLPLQISQANELGQGGAFSNGELSWGLDVKYW